MRNVHRQSTLISTYMKLKINSW